MKRLIFCCVMSFLTLGSVAFGDTILHCKVESRFARNFDGSMSVKKNPKIEYFLLMNSDHLAVSNSDLQYPMSPPVVFEHLKRTVGNQVVGMKWSEVNTSFTSDFNIEIPGTRYLDQFAHGEKVKLWLSRSRWDSEERFPVTLFQDTSLCSIDRR